MSIGVAQKVFTLNVAKLIEWAYANGYELSFAEAYRSAEQAMINTGKYKLVHIETKFEQSFPFRGIANSLHRDRLAIDLNLFKDGVFLSDSNHHAPLGIYWKSLHEKNRWGGDFSKPDGNHYEMNI